MNPRTMTVNLENMLRQAGLSAESGDEIHGGGHAFMLSELGRHLRELRDRYRAGDAGVVEEFFALYVLSEPKESE